MSGLVLDRPSELFDRDQEWRALSAFATAPAPGAILGVISGRRRQGKTFLLCAPRQATGGFYFAADEATDRESLNRLGSAPADHLNAPGRAHVRYVAPGDRCAARGSAMSFMGRLLSGNAPLRGRAGLELIVPTLDHCLAAEFWGIQDSITAVDGPRSPVSRSPAS
jgi:hypothetical protein